jgi:branched-chain amino acid transport system substrate-binding protein
MNKGVAVLAIVILIAGGVLFAKHQKTQSQPTHNSPIKVGGLLTLTGINSDAGKAIQEGMEIAKAEINSRGGIHGKQLELIYEDAPSMDPKVVVSGGTKLMTIDKVSAVLDFPYTGIGSLEAVAEQQHVPLIDVIDSSEQIASYGDWIVSSGIYAEGVGAHVAQFARENLGNKKAASLVGKDEYLYAVSNGFEHAWTAQGGTLTIHEEYEVGTTDFRSQLSKIIATNPEAIFVGHFGEGGPIIKQARELGYTGVFLGSDTFSLADVAAGAGDYINSGVYFGLWRNFDVQTTGQQSFATKYEQRFGKPAGDYLFYNVLGYDGVMVLAKALEKSDLSGSSIKDELYKIKDLPGLSGSITIDSTGINRDPKSAMVTYKDGKIVRAE